MQKSTREHNSLVLPINRFTNSQANLCHFVGKNFSWILLLSNILILVFGLTLNTIIINFAEEHEHNKLLTNVSLMIPGLDPKLISELTGSDTDINKPQFQQIKRYLSDLRAANSNFRFVYLMGKQSNNIVFLADAEDETSPAYSAPGEVYEEASGSLFQIFADGKPFTEGPITDNYGEWVSAHAAIFNHDTDKVVAIIGADINVRDWEKANNIYRWFSLAITLLLVLINASFLLSISRITKDREQREKTNKDLANLLAKVKLLEGIIPICMYCKNIRDDKEIWQKVEKYLTENSEAKFSHSICPKCAEKHHPEEFKRIAKKGTTHHSSDPP